MNMNQETVQKLEKTIERMQRALEYNDREYCHELIRDLTEFAYFSGYKEANTSYPSYPIPIKNNKNNKHEFSFADLTPGSIEERIAKVLHKLGIPAHTKGFKFLIEAISSIYTNPKNIAKLTNVIYPIIAKKYNTTTSRVFRAINHCLEQMWKRADAEFLSVVLGGYPINKEDSDSKPEQSTFIYQVAMYLQNPTSESTIDQTVQDNKETNPKN